MSINDTLLAISDAVYKTTSVKTNIRRSSPVGGGSINSCYRLDSDAHSYFVKLSNVSGLTMLEAEMDGLSELAASGVLRVPQPICCGQSGDKAFLVMEYIHFGRTTTDSAARLGGKLAMMHQQTSNYFGWYRDNTIGITPQPNSWDHDWIRFYGERRLAPQFRLLAEKSNAIVLQTLGEQLIAGMNRFFGDYRPTPSLLHGDLWSGNFATDDHGAPVIFDPAVYYGDREADLAMTELFGGFPDAFYAAYRERWPLDMGYEHRKTLYNLYHVLNHANMFGGDYSHQAEQMTKQLLGELG